MRRLWPLIAALTIMLGGCAIQLPAGLGDVETVSYESADGYRLVLPAAWTAEEDEDSVSFSGAEGAVLLNISSEFAGVEYYAPEELAALLLEQLPAQAFSPVGEARQERTSGGYTLYVSEGANSEGQPLISCLRIVSPGASVRFYLWFFCSAQYYDGHQRLLEDIADSFEIAADEQRLYQLMSEYSEEKFTELYPPDADEQGTEQPPGDDEAPVAE